MFTSKVRYSHALLGTLGIAMGLASATGCAADRPSRNGVFNENHYLRKSFIVRPGENDPTTNQPTDDPGWVLKSTVTEVSSPDPLGGMLGVFAGTQSSGELVRFAVTEDKLQMISLRNMSTAPSTGITPQIFDSWGATNVDIKYQVNLDGEKTNFLQENQEANWQDRQWVKVVFDKNDMGDVAPLGDWTTEALQKCTDMGNAAATLVPNSFIADEKHDYLTWNTQITLPLKWDDPSCIEAYGPMGDAAIRLGRQNVTFNLMYSMIRAVPDNKLTYKPLVIDEKDPIRHKYGPIESTSIVRDEKSGQLASKEMVVRFDPEKDIVWYFDKGFPENYKAFFNGPNGIKDQTNKLMADAGAKSHLIFKNFDEDLGEENIDANGAPLPRQFGDVRYSFLRWVNDKDMQDSFAGVTQFLIDPRTGEAMTSSIVFNDFAIKDYYVQRIAAYLQSMGAWPNDANGNPIDINSDTPWPDTGACKDGDLLPLVPATAKLKRNANSSLFGKMQEYLQKPKSQFGDLAPSDFIATNAQDPDFTRGYYPLVGYAVFADPDTNQFVTREGGEGVYGPDAMWKKLSSENDFHQLAAKVDRGENPYENVASDGAIKGALNFANTFRTLTTNHRDVTYSKTFLNRHNMRFMDSPEAFSFEQVIAKDARHCIGGKWETKDEWIQNMIDTYWSQVAWHEFGHSLGMEHNFMASVDKPNFPEPKTGPDGVQRYGLYASSVMEYNAAPDRVFWDAGWAPYDRGAIAFMYANSAQPTDKPGTSLSGQISANGPWKDPYGFANDGTERQFLRCSEAHLKYTPLCRQGDMGTTPSEIIANEIENYEWQYQWRNFRVYRKIWDNTNYADTPANMITDMRRFLSMWAYDWSNGEVADTLRRIGVTNPEKNGDDQAYYDQLDNKFTNEISTANQMIAAFHKAVIQQSSGERPYATTYDKFYGDETQQGIILDKLFAMQGWVGLWPTDNYDQNQAGGYISSYSTFGEPTYEAVAEDVVSSMVGTQYDAYTYFIPTAVALFAQDTHSSTFSGRIEVRDWIGGLTFTRQQDFLDYFRNIAVQNGKCTDTTSCTYDPRIATISDTWNEFTGPDNRVWVWSYIADRNSWVVARKDRNVATYRILHSYNDDIVHNLDDGHGGTYSFLLPVKYTLDSFGMFN